MELSRDVRDKADIVFTSHLSLPEVMSAFNRSLGEKHCSKSDLNVVRNEFLKVWPNFQKIKATEKLVQHAGQLVFTHNLRGFDAVHLASALVLKEEGNGIETFFSCFDKNLNQAALKEGLQVHKKP
ncbi:MAG: type II toxin-antitoxin system VapC family toxin [Desulfobacterales bacterium]|nr:type II toxin-antitoxin system VapC family toxin [Desulfobacterales bacterium]